MPPIRVCMMRPESCIIIIIIITIILFAHKIQSYIFIYDNTRVGQTRLQSSYSCPNTKYIYQIHQLSKVHVDSVKIY